MMWLIAMRDAAVLRHKMVHILAENADPNKWPLHEFIIDCVYGPFLGPRLRRD